MPETVAPNRFLKDAELREALSPAAGLILATTEILATGAKLESTIDVEALLAELEKVNTSRQDAEVFGFSPNPLADKRLRGMIRVCRAALVFLREYREVSFQ